MKTISLEYIQENNAVFGGVGLGIPYAESTTEFFSGKAGLSWLFHVINSLSWPNRVRKNVGLAQRPVPIQRMQDFLLIIVLKVEMIIILLFNSG